MTKLIVVGNTAAGGVGKTTLVQLLAEMNRRGGSELVVMLADDKGKRVDGGVDVADMLPHHKVVWLGAGPDSASIEADPDALNRHWDKLDAVLKEHSVLLDLGANVLQRLGDYATRMRLASRWAKKGIGVEMWVPFNNTPSNIECALTSLQLGATAFGTQALVAVRNEKDGPFTGWDGSPYAKAFKAFEKAGTRVVTLPKCPAPTAGMEAAMRHRVGFFSIADMDEDDVPGALAVDGPVALRTKFGVEDWITATYSQFAGLVPERAGELAGN